VNFGRLTRAQIRQQERQQRQEGNAMFRELVKNPNIERCTYCLNDDCPPHGNSRSSLCHAHQPTLETVLENILGRGYQMKVRKCTLRQALRIRRFYRRTRLKTKARIMQEVNRVVDWVREVSIKTQCFIQFYILNKFAAGDDLEPGFFKSNCIYGFMQLVMGQNVTNNDPSFPNDRSQVFMEYRDGFKDPSTCTTFFMPGYAQCLSFMKDQISTMNKNAITETFRLRAEKYLAYKLKQGVDHEVKTN
jgi:hypothetical protein